MIELHDLTTVDECRDVVVIQEAVWGAGSEIVPASVLVASAKRGGILIGAMRDGRPVGFVWSMPGWHDGIATQWSHMLGVLPDARQLGLGRQLKLAQRLRALERPCDLIEWTFDPLQAPNAHLNLSTLGCIVTTYLENVYGAMQGPLHRGTATDRLVAEWWIRRPHVERRLAALGQLVARSADVLDAVPVIDTHWDGPYLICGRVHTDVEATRVLVPVPNGFTDLQRDAIDLARAWRQATREAFQSYFSRGYRAVDFLFDRDRGDGRYLLARTS